MVTFEDGFIDSAIANNCKPQVARMKITNNVTSFYGYILIGTL